MSTEKTIGIVTRIVDFSESSYVVDLFTRDFGKIGCIAKGAKRLKNPFESAIDLLALSRIVFLHKTSDSLDILTEAKLNRRFRSATQDLPRLYAGYYIAELLNSLTHEGEAHIDLFNATDRALAALDNGADTATVVLRYELLALRSLGHLPSLDTCTGCGLTPIPGDPVAFGPTSGGVLCGECRRAYPHVVNVSSSTIYAMQHLADAEARRWPGLDPRHYGELRRVLNHYISHLLGHRPKMYRYFRQFQKMEKK